MKKPIILSAILSLQISLPNLNAQESKTSPSKKNNLEMNLNSDSLGYVLNKGDSLVQLKKGDSASVKINLPKPQPILTHFRVYTDAKGFTNPQEPNGLMQSEFGMSVVLHKKNYLKGIFNDIELRTFYNVFAQVNLVQLKSDSSFQFAPLIRPKITNTTTAQHLKDSLYIHTLNILKYAGYQYTIKGNLLSAKFKESGISLYFDAEFALFSTLLRLDTLTSRVLNLPADKRTFNLYSFGKGFNLRAACFPPRSNWGVEIGWEALGIHLISNDFHQGYGKLRSIGEQQLQREDVVAGENAKSNYNVLHLNLNFFYSAGKINMLNPSHDGLFFRIQVFTNPSLLNSKINYANQYVRIQVGVSKSIEEMFKFIRS